MKKLLCLCAGALLFAACAKKNDPIANVKEAAKDKDLQGTFTSDCQAKPLDASVEALIAAYTASKALVTNNNSPNSNNSSSSPSDAGKGVPLTSTVAYTFTGARVTKTTTLFTDQTCQNKAGEYKEEGTIDIDKSKKTNDGGYNINMDFKNLKAVVTNPDTANIANTAKLCGAGDWNGGQKPRDVTAHSKDLTCANTPLPRHVANIYRVDAGTLYLGTLTKGANLDKDRPTSLNSTKFHKE